MLNECLKFGPAGIGHVKDVDKTFGKYKKLGIKAAEIPFTYGVYIKDKKIAEEIGKNAEKFGIVLSIHAPYWINLNSKEKEKVEASKTRILKSCEIGHYLSLGYGSKQKIRVVFHAGFYSGMDREKVYWNIKKEVLEMIKIVRDNKWSVELCVEIMGKKNVFGSIDEVSRIVKETGCGFCVDFAHVLARYGKLEKEEFDLLEKSFPQKDWHCHFSGIVFNEKGEQKHKKTQSEEWEKVLKFVKSMDKNMVIINEANNPVEDSVEGLKIYKDLL